MIGIHSPLVQWLGYGPFKAETRVQFPDRETKIFPLKLFILYKQQAFLQFMLL
jgi:hypothetical protein